MRNEAAQKAVLDSAKETAERMIRKGKMSLEEIYQSKSNIVTALGHIETEIYMLYFFAIMKE